MGMRIFEVHIERRRISSVDSIKTFFTALQLNAALVVRVENPHVPPLPKGPGWCQLLPRLYCYERRIRARCRRRTNVMD
jgi:hypothetical protein